MPMALNHFYLPCQHLHHFEYEVNPLGVKKIEELIKEKKAVYNIRADMKMNKFQNNPELKLLDLNKLPKYIINNQNKFSDWIEKI